MKMLVKFTDYYRKPGTENRMVYVDENGRLFDGPEHDIVVGDLYNVELSNKTQDDEYWYIIKFL